MTHNLEISEVSLEDARFTDFIAGWEDDIETIFPHFTEEDADFSSLYMLKVDGKDSGVFIYQRKGEELHVHVDYIIPEFRDVGIGNSFFKSKIEEFKETGFSIIVALTNNDVHIKYLLDVGFEQSTKHPHRYELYLQAN